MSSDFYSVITFLEEYLKNPEGRSYGALETALAAFICQPWCVEIRRDQNLQNKVGLVREAIKCAKPGALCTSVEEFVRLVEVGEFRNDVHVRCISQVLKDHHPAYVRVHANITTVA